LPARVLTLTRTSPALQGPLIYYGGFLKTGAGGASTVDLFDGLSATDDPLDSFATIASGHENRYLPGGLYCMRGIFVNIGNNVTAFVLYYDQDESEAVGGPREGPT
jgi:hypothetical protein